MVTQIVSVSGKSLCFVVCLCTTIVCMLRGYANALLLHLCFCFFFLYIQVFYMCACALFDSSLIFILFVQQSDACTLFGHTYKIIYLYVYMYVCICIYVF